MLQGNKTESEENAGHRRSQGVNIFMLILSGVILMILCVLLLVRVYSLNETIDSLRTQTEELNQIIEEQRGQLVKLELLEQRMEELQEDKDTKEDSSSREEGEREQESTEPESTAAHKVYLTFDDGPSIYTQDILDILDRYNIKATFFIVGKENDAAKEAMKRIVEEGHTLAMHSYTHNYHDIYASVENFAEDFARIQNYIYDVTGIKSTVYRFPGGSSNTISKIDMAEFAEYLDQQDIRFFDWNISSGDGGSYVFPVETLLENCTSKIENYETSVILMHDSAGKKTTLEALPQIIETILGMEDTEILPITANTTPVQHIKWQDSSEDTAE